MAEIRTLATAEGALEAQQDDKINVSAPQSMHTEAVLQRSGPVAGTLVRYASFIRIANLNEEFVPQVKGQNHV